MLSKSRVPLRACKNPNLQTSLCALTQNTIPSGNSVLLKAQVSNRKSKLDQGHIFTIEKHARDLHSSKRERKRIICDPYVSLKRERVEVFVPHYSLRIVLKQYHLEYNMFLTCFHFFFSE